MAHDSVHSAVTHAALENWQYMDIIREAADPTCADHLVNSIKTIDSILLHSPAFIKRQLKNVFGLGELKHDEDFVSVLEVRYISHSQSTATNFFRRALLALGKLNAGIPRLGVRNSMIFAILSTALSEVWLPPLYNFHTNIQSEWWTLVRAFRSMFLSLIMGNGSKRLEHLVSLVLANADLGQFSMLCLIVPQNSQLKM